MLALLFIIIIWKEVTDVGQLMNITDEQHFSASHWSKLKCSVGTLPPASLRHATSYSFKTGFCFSAFMIEGLSLYKYMGQLHIVSGVLRLEVLVITNKHNLNESDPIRNFLLQWYPLVNEAIGPEVQWISLPDPALRNGILLHQLSKTLQNFLTWLKPDEDLISWRPGPKDIS